MNEGKGIHWATPDGQAATKMVPNEPIFADEGAYQLSIQFFTSPDLGRLMLPLVDFGPMHVKAMIVAPPIRRCRRGCTSCS